MSRGLRSVRSAATPYCGVSPSQGRTRIPVKLIVTQLLAQVLASSGKTLYGCQMLIARLLAPYPSLCSGKCYSTPRCESMETNSSANGSTRSRALAVDERASPNVAEATACRPSLQLDVDLRLKAILFRSHLVELLEEGFHQVVLLHGLED